MNRAKRVRGIDWDDVRQRLESVSRGERSLDAGHAQRVLEERAALLAHVPVEAQSAQARFELLRFKLGAQRCAIEACFIHEVRKPVALTRLPGAPTHLLGITNLRGEILPVFDLRDLLRAGHEETTDSARLLVLGERSPELCVSVDAVYEIAWIARDSVLEASHAAFGLSGTYLRGVTHDALVVLDGAALLAGHQLYIGDADDPLGQEGNS
jgi:purine-binding chemotaxis protein CheW